MTVWRAAASIFCSSAADKPRGADHVHDLLFGGRRREADGGLGAGKIDDRIALGDQRHRVARDLHAHRPHTRKDARVLAEFRRADALDRAREHEARAFADRADERAAHAARRTRDQDAQVGHVSLQIPRGI